MIFEYDPQKSDSNFKKHGIDFEEAKKLWKSDILTLRSKNEFEIRLLVIGKIESKFWTAIITIRGIEKNIVRLISVRRSRNEEKKLYEKFK